MESKVTKTFPFRNISPEVIVGGGTPFKTCVSNRPPSFYSNSRLPKKTNSKITLSVRPIQDPPQSLCVVGS